MRRTTVRATSNPNICTGLTLAALRAAPFERLRRQCDSFREELECGRPLEVGTMSS